MLNLWTRFLNDENAATAIEYALIAGSIAIGIIGAVRLVGQNLSASLLNTAGSFH